QPFDALAQLAQGAEDQHRRVDVVGAHLGEDLQAVGARQHAVEDDAVVGAGQCHLQTLIAVVQHVDLVALTRQHPADQAGQFDFVFYQQQPHDVTSIARADGDGRRLVIVVIVIVVVPVVVSVVVVPIVIPVIIVVIGRGLLGSRSRGVVAIVIDIVGVVYIIIPVVDVVQIVIPIVV